MKEEKIEVKKKVESEDEEESSDDGVFMPKSLQKKKDNGPEKLSKRKMKKEGISSLAQ